MPHLNSVPSSGPSVATAPVVALTTVLETLMARGVDVHSSLGAPGLSGPAALLAPEQRLLGLMRTGPLPRPAPAKPTPEPSPACTRLELIESPLWWSLAQRAAAALCLLALLPLLPLLWLAVRLSSPGPFLFRQLRSGLGDEPFVIHRIRTLSIDAARDLARHEDSRGAGRTALDGSRRYPPSARLGRLLRRLHIDELPQLWNILRGDMEFVGPRPIPIALEDHLRAAIPQFMERNRVKPGLTELPQVAVIDDRPGAGFIGDWHGRFDAELQYIRRKSFGYDVITLLSSLTWLMRSLAKTLRGRPRPRAGVPTATLVLGVPIADLDLAGALDRMEGWIQAKKPRYIALCPAQSVIEAVRRRAHRTALRGAGLCITDSLPIAWAQRRLGNHEATRIDGPTVMLEALGRARTKGWRVALYGAYPDRRDRLVEHFRTRYPGLNLVAAIAPPCRPLTPEEDAAATRHLAALEPDLVLVGLDGPDQERWMAGHCGRIPVVMLGVGHAFDACPDATQRSPLFLQRLGLERFLRLMCEPRRRVQRFAANAMFVTLFVMLFATQWAKRTFLGRRYRIELGFEPDAAVIRTR